MTTEIVPNDDPRLNVPDKVYYRLDIGIKVDKVRVKDADAIIQRFLKSLEVPYYSKPGECRFGIRSNQTLLLEEPLPIRVVNFGRRVYVTYTTIKRVDHKGHPLNNIQTHNLENGDSSL